MARTNCPGSVSGNILAHGSISLATGAVLDVGAPANVGAVMLQGNTVTRATTMQGSPLPTAETFGLWTLVGRLYL
jgi:hypothetical protein